MALSQQRISSVIPHSESYQFYQQQTRICTYVELLDLSTTAFTGGYSLDLHNHNRVSAGSMTSSHITVYNT